MSLHQGFALNSPLGRTVRFEQTDAAPAILSPAPETRQGLSVGRQLVPTFCGSSRVRNGSWQGLPVFGSEEEQAMHDSSAVFYQPGQPARSVRPSQSAQHAQLCCLSTAESRGWGWVNPNIRIAWILAGSIPPYPCGCLCVIFMLIRKLIIPFSRLCELGGLPLNTWSSSWGWERCVSEREREWACLSACLCINRVCCGHRCVQTARDCTWLQIQGRNCTNNAEIRKMPCSVCPWKRVPLGMLSGFAYQKEKYFLPGAWAA